MYHDDLHGPSISHHFFSWRLLGLFVGMALGAAAIFLWALSQAPGGFASAWSAATLPMDLQERIFLGSGGERSTAYRVHGVRFIQTSAEVPGLSSAFSPNGAMYVRAVASSTASVQSSVRPDEWHLYLVPKEGPAEYLGNGYAPAFLSDTHIAYLTRSGIVVRNLATGESKLLHGFGTEVSIRPEVQYSPDRSLVLWTNAATSETVVARITPDSYESLHVFALPPALRLTDVALYEVRPKADGTEIWQWGFDGSEPKKVNELPPSLGIISIL